MKLTSLVLAVALTGTTGDVGAVGPSPATAESDPLAEAKAEYRKGSSAYQTGRYEQAVRHFERSFELSHRSDLLYNLGQAYSRWHEVSDDPHHLRRARRLFKNYVAAVQNRPDMKESRADAKLRIAEIDRQLEMLDAKPRTGPESGGSGSAADKPVYKKGWFWGTIVGVVVVAAAATTAGILVSRRRREAFEPELGTLGEFERAPTGLGFRF